MSNYLATVIIFDFTNIIHKVYLILSNMTKFNSSFLSTYQCKLEVAPKSPTEDRNFQKAHSTLGYKCFYSEIELEKSTIF